MTLRYSQDSPPLPRDQQDQQDMYSDRKPGYLSSVISERELGQTLQDLREFHSDRNTIALTMREHVGMTNKIETPDVSRWEPKTLRMGEMRSFLNERLAQFRADRVVQVVPPSISPDDQAKATRLEKAISSALYWMRRTRDAWGMVLADVLLLEGGVERWEMTPQQAWPNLIPGDDLQDEYTRKYAAQLVNIDPDSPEFKKIMGQIQDDKDEYKKSRPWPISNTYVPLEYWYPAHDGNDLDFGLEIEFRPLRSVVRNELFDSAARKRLQVVLGENKHNIKQEVTIVRYCDDEAYCYFALAPSRDNTHEQRTKPKDTKSDSRLDGDPLYLHGYEHMVGRPLYNEVMGAHGGWRSGDTTLIAGRIRAMLGLAQARDDLASQLMTNVRNTMWPNYVIKLNSRRPDATDSEEDGQDAISRNLGEDVVLYEDESINPLVEARPNPNFELANSEVKTQFRLIAGSTSLAGQHQEGVGTGYQENLLITRAESQFARVEQGMATGAGNGVLLMLQMIRAGKERVWVRARDRKFMGRSVYEDLYIDPEEHLSPLPELDVTVRAPRPIEWASVLQQARDALSDISGPNTALLSRQVVLTEMLGREHPDEDELQRRIEDQEDEVWASGTPTQLIQQFLNLNILQGSRPSPGTAAQQAALMDPNFAQQALAFVSGQPAPGAPVQPLGPDGQPIQQQAPGLPSQQMPQPENAPGIGQGAGGGLPMGAPQPNQTIGREQQIMGQPAGIPGTY